MVTYKTKKVSKYRGSSNHGGGMRKKRRGAGSRGGRGNAGTGKRAGQKKAGLKNFKLGSIGFRPRREVTAKHSINVGDLTSAKLNAWAVDGKATKEGAGFSVDLGQLGYTKLLGAGDAVVKLTITIPSCSASAMEKIKSKGGQVQVS